MTEYESSMHNAISREILSTVYTDGDSWKGYTYSEDMNKYYFDDIGSDGPVDEILFLNIWKEQGMKCNDCDAVATSEMDELHFCEDCLEDYLEEN